MSLHHLFELYSIEDSEITREQIFNYVVNKK